MFLMGLVERRTPVVFDCPTGAAVPVNLELQISSFSGYESAETSTYLGTQCHGVMWPETPALPAAWPIAPPIVSGKVKKAPIKTVFLIKNCLWQGELAGKAALTAVQGHPVCHRQAHLIFLLLSGVLHWNCPPSFLLDASQQH